MDEPRTDTVDPSLLSAAPQPIRLVVLSGPDAGRQLDVREGTVLVGAHPDCQLKLSDPAASRRHCALELLGARIRVRDLSSKNGTRYLGARITSVDVPLGASIDIGSTTLALLPTLREGALSDKQRLGDLVGRSPAMRRLFALLEQLAAGDATVLIRGETGTGKEAVARALHAISPRAAGPFVAFDCGAANGALVQSVLFGHVRGAFTGAHTNKRGLFEKANGGTLFLDEVGDMGLALQGKLLRVLQDREIRPVGGTQTVKVDVRIIAATNKDLPAEIAAGRFREDLFYRLNVVPIHVPPLRERPDDIPALVEAFLRRHGEGRRRFVSAEALAVLRTLPWRGNARELENTIERALALSDTETLGPADIPLPASAGAAPGAAASAGVPPDLDAHLRSAAARGMSLRELDEKYTAVVLAHTGGNKVRASQILGIDRKTLYRRAERRAHEEGAGDEE